MSSLEDLLQQKISDLEAKINQKNTEVADLSLKLNDVDHILRNHTHSGGETSGRLEPRILKISTINATVYQTSGTAGLTGTITVRNSAGTGTCTITVVSGIITATTC
jgi:hypothetical protein